MRNAILMLLLATVSTSAMAEWARLAAMKLIPST